MLRRLPGYRSVERQEKAGIVSRLREQIDPLFGRGDQRRLLTGAQKRRGMVRERKCGGTTSESAKANRLPGNVAVAAMHAVEESNGQNQGLMRIPPQFVKD